MTAAQALVEYEGEDESEIEINLEGTYYEILGVERNATTQEIRAAFRRLSKLYHPDIRGHDDDEAFRKLSLAHATLIDKQQRFIYDNDPNFDSIESSLIWQTAKSLLHEMLQQMLMNEKYDIDKNASIQKMIDIFKSIRQVHRTQRKKLKRLIDSLDGLIATMKVKEGKRPSNLLADVIAEQKEPLVLAFDEADREVKAITVLIRELKCVDQVFALYAPFDGFVRRDDRDVKGEPGFSTFKDWGQFFDDENDAATDED